MKIIKFSAPWCGPCSQYSPIFKAVANSHSSENVTFEEVDVEESPEKARQFGIMSVPATVVLKEDEEIIIETGVLSEEQLINLI